jgi:hypothetical protein
LDKVLYGDQGMLYGVVILDYLPQDLSALIILNINPVALVQANFAHLKLVLVTFI